MPTLFRLVFVVGLLGSLSYGVVVLLATLVEPEPREIVVTVPFDQITRQR